LDVSRINRRTFLSGAALAATGCMGKIIHAADALEESPDRREGPEFVEHSIKVISDDDLFAALDLRSSELKQVRGAVEARDFPGAYRAWGEYWQTVASRRGHYFGEGNLILPRDEALRSLEPRRGE